MHEPKDADLEKEARKIYMVAVQQTHIKLDLLWDDLLERLQHKTAQREKEILQNWFDRYQTIWYNEMRYEIQFSGKMHEVMHFLKKDLKAKEENEIDFRALDRIDKIANHQTVKLMVKLLKDRLDKMGKEGQEKAIGIPSFDSLFGEHSSSIKNIALEEGMIDENGKSKLKKKEKYKIHGLWMFATNIRPSIVVWDGTSAQMACECIAKELGTDIGESYISNSNAYVKGSADKYCSHLLKQYEKKIEW